MKTLISVNEIKSLASAGKKVHYVDAADTIITPAARDAAREWGITLEAGPAPINLEVSQRPVKGEDKVSSEPLASSVNQEMITRIVMEVMAKLKIIK